MAKTIPQRMCVGCGQMNTKNNMMKVIKTKENEIVLDVSMKQSGRGAYLCKCEECINKARKNRGLERSFKMSIDSKVYDLIEKEFLVGKE